MNGKKINVIFWDTETNGLEAKYSVLSISALKYIYTITENYVTNENIDQYERFYFRKPGEPPGKRAIGVNGLTDDVLKLKRKDADYPECFCDDINSFRDFCSDTRHFVGHNISYDTQYINFKLKNKFCTMRENTKIIKLRKKNGKLKYPSLGETACFYGIETDKNELHGSMYDSLVVYRIFNKMIEKRNANAMLFLEPVIIL
jgi:DNA polymerase-3 subunit epsilon